MDVKELLREAADEAQVSPRIPAHVARRARRRRTRNGILAGVTAVALLVGAGFGVRGAVGLVDRDAERRVPGGETSWKGVWPQDSREAAEQAQELADAGDDRATWQRQGEEVVRRYAEVVLGFPGAYIVDYPVHGLDDAGPVTATVSDCDESVGVSVCKGAPRAEVTIQRLLRADRTGIWFVTSSGSSQARVTEKAVRAFVNRFMEARIDRAPSAHDFLSRNAATQYHRGDGGVGLYGEYLDWKTESIDAVTDRGEYRVIVSIDRPGSATTLREQLFVGSNTAQRDGALVVRAALPDVPPSQFDVLPLVEEFMDARLVGPMKRAGERPAESFLSSVALAGYQRRSQSSLYLYGAPWGDPALRYDRYRILSEDHAGGPGFNLAVVVEIEAMPVASGGGAASFREVLYVGPGFDFHGERQFAVIVSAERIDV